MQRKKIKVINRLGIHARAAAKLVGTASRYQSEITIHFKNRAIDAKNIIDVMVLAARQGSDIELVACGEDETEAITALEALIHERFGEEE